MSVGFLAGEQSDMLDPEAIAPLVVHLVSPASGAVSGEVFRVRHGRIATVRSAAAAGVAPAGARWTVEEIARRMDEIRGADA